MSGGNGTNGTPAKQGKNRPMPPVEYQFKPGQSGNPSGRPKGTGKSITAQLRKLLNDGLDGKDLADAMAKKAYQMALKGDFRFWEAIMDRLDGKVKDKLEVEGLNIKVVYEDTAPLEGIERS